jgi:hypothetical protein
MERTDRERVEHLDRLLGFGRGRRNLTLHWEAGNIVVSVFPAADGGPRRGVMVGSGWMVGAAIDQAISRHAAQAAKIKEKLERKERAK